MKCRIVTEGGSFDKALLEAVLRERLPGQDIEVIDAGGKSNTISLARTLLIDTQRPVALVANADTVDPDIIAEQRKDLETALDRAADPSLWTVVLFEPAIERCFFRDIPFIEKVLGCPLTDVQRALTEYDPRKILLALERNYKTTLLEKLRNQSLAPLMEDPALKTLCIFVEKASQKHGITQRLPITGLKSTAT